MTDPTREAFEAWWNYCDIPWAEEPEHFAWQAWQAALSARAQGEAVAYRDDAGNLYPSKESLLKYLPVGRSAEPLYTTPAARAVDVDGLRSALKQAAADLKAYGHLAAAGRALAALPGKTEVDRG